MKPIRFMLSGIALLLAVSWVQAQDKQPTLPALPPVQPLLPMAQPQLFMPGSDLLSAKGLDKLKLTKAQKADYDKLSDEYKKKHKELFAKVFDLTKNLDANSFKANIEARQKLRPDYLAKVEKLLTDDQKKIFAEVRRENPGFGSGLGFGGGFPAPLAMLPFGSTIGGPFLPASAQKELKLTDDQRKKVNELQKELETKIMGVLTDDQKKAFEELKKRRTGPGIVFPRPLELPKLPLPGGLPKLPPPGLDKQVNPLPPAVERARPAELKKIDK